MPSFAVHAIVRGVESYPLRVKIFEADIVLILIVNQNCRIKAYIVKNYTERVHFRRVKHLLASSL